MPTCVSIKNDNRVCGNNMGATDQTQHPHMPLCGLHHRVYLRRAVFAGDHIEGNCIHFQNNNRWCGHQAEANARICARHRRDNERQAEVARAVNERRVIMDTVLNAFLIENPTGPVIDVSVRIFEHDMLAPVERYTIARRYFNFVLPGVQNFQFERMWLWVRTGQQGPPPVINRDEAQPPPAPLVRVPELGRIANDRQNVHVAIVSEQTNKMLEILLKCAPATGGPRAPEWFASKWLVAVYGNWNDVRIVVDDMQRWYRCVTVKNQNDRLYKRALDGAYIKISQTKDDAVRKQLYKRVFQECMDSVAMCAEGHISRICNVFVGFDDAFQPPVPFGEILQNRMSAISKLEVDTDEKIRQATEFFNEYAVPELERNSWLEAF